MVIDRIGMVQWRDKGGQVAVHNSSTPF